MSEPRAQAEASEPASWPRGPEAPALEGSVVDVWRSALEPDPARRARLEGLLSPGELERASRFRFDRDAHRYVIARGVLRTLLGRYQGRPPDSIGLEESEHGRPFDPSEVGAGRLDFNVSHSQDRLLVAFTRAGRVGVDIEWMSPLPDMAELVELNFSPAEQATWRSLADDQRERGFFACWTRKEAFVKAVGQGLSHPLQSFDVSLAPGDEARLERIENGRPDAWTLRALDADPGYAAALAVEAPSAALRLWSL